MGVSIQFFFFSGPYLTLSIGRLADFPDSGRCEMYTSYWNCIEVCIIKHVLWKSKKIVGAVFKICEKSLKVENLPKLQWFIKENNSRVSDKQKTIILSRQRKVS